ncbi:hypothetical protein G17_00608 [Escherichia phage vB_EcoM_G17]|uniref:Uncharacterized protein n=1 Tax=Escherichia phage vB_Eco_slurp01 TaxID=1874688 RepID=A0A1C3S6K7_9CAUD|nr:hypothetical protein G17_00608 [Escherichia phage vB_EcoM_G17]WNN14334.1 hypothetical protein Sharanji_gp046 [Escherichia phage Sharanji]SCA80197.1 hypothetical protein PSLUR01_00220 [Escherichia phage vB_Eco_slurp01]
MKHLSNIEKMRIIIDALNKYDTLLQIKGLTRLEHKINTTDVRMLAVLGTNFQEEYVIAHIVALKNYIMDKCNEHH